MTLIEILIVISLLAMINLALYNSLSNGLKVWKKSQNMIIEEDIAIFFDKITNDLHNSFYHAKLKYEGSTARFRFPTIIYMPADTKSSWPEDSYIHQIGQVEYLYNSSDKTIVRKMADYGLALRDESAQAIPLVKGVERLKFTYFYSTPTEEIVSDQILELLPGAVRVEVLFSDIYGKRTMEKWIEIPIES